MQGDLSGAVSGENFAFENGPEPAGKLFLELLIHVRSGVSWSGCSLILQGGGDRLIAVEITAIPVDVYLHETWSPDREYVDGEVIERNWGE